MKRISLKLALTSMLLLSGPADSFDIEHVPLFLSNQVDPNLILTLDDSGSMRRAYVPELCGDSSDCAALDNRWAKSAQGNGLYYNPQVTYSAPVGAERKTLTTQFDAAWRNGYYRASPFNQTVNLSSNYLPTAALDMTGYTSCAAGGGSDGDYECYMGHFTGQNSEREVSGVMLGNKNNQEVPYFDITGFVDVDGSVNGVDPGSNLVSVSVNGFGFSGDGNSDKDNCNPSVQPADGRYRSRLINSNTLRLCFNENNSGAAVVVRLKASASSQGGEPTSAFGGVPAYYYLFDASQPGCADAVAQQRNNGCYRYVRHSPSSGPNGSDERQNFANWYSFYRTRNLATQGSASLAFSELSPRIRVAWQALNTCHDIAGDKLVTSSCWGWQGQGTKFGSNAIQEFGDSQSQHRQNFYDWLFRLPTSGDTPLRQAMSRAGMYFSDSTTANSPYANNPGTVGSGQFSCRRNYHALMTDGIWNDEKDFNDTDDNNGQTLPDGTRYKNSADYAQVYADITPHTLADMAFYYWLTDLAPSLSDNLSPITTEEDSDGNGVLDQAETIYWNPKNNPASWQHMVNFTIGLGLTDFLGAAGLNWSGDMYGGSYSSLRSGALEWPPATKWMGKTDPKYADVYGKSAPDLWHAAINSRGRFFSAETPETLQYSFEKLLSLIEAATPTAAALATNSTRTSGSSGQSTRIFQARFDTRYWNGQLYALEVNAVSGSVSGPVWNAATVLPAANARSIYIRKGNASEHLTWSNLTNEQKGHLNQSDNLGSQRLDWLRGDHRLEQRYTGGQFRNRIAFERGYDGQARQDRSEWVLGDIISSDPVYLGADNQHYDQLAAGSGGKSSYAAYVNYKKTRAPMLYVGANDGMLHAFRVSDGVEQFAVIPNAVFPNLHLLTNPDYSHRYFVDGSPGAGDAYLNNSLSDSSGWNSVVVSGLRAGGKSVFAVDATNPADDLPARFMWEFNADESDNDMGYSYSQPQVVRLNDGNWAAVFGNGYNSSKGGVHLYVVRLSDGVLLKKITALATDNDNGLSTPTLVDSDGDRIVDMAYAGDLKGNLWKFDLKSGSSSNWSVSKLFTAVDSSGNTQPITVQPTALKGDGGIWVFVGTGRLLAKEDIGASAMSAKQSFYGLWDNNQPIAGRGVLVSQTITNTTSKNGMSLRVTSDNEVNLTSKRGWYMDLSDSGERVIAEATTVIDNVSSTDNRIIFTTAIPSADPCNAQGSSWLMELSFTGRRPSKPVFDLNQDYQFKTGDDTVLDGVIPTGMGSTVGLMDSVTWLDRDARVGFKLVPGTRGKVQTITNRGRGVAGRPQRINWQQLL